MPQRAAGDFNQALMELGALVCTPATPRCAECPVARDCVANRLGRQDGIPLRSGKPEPVDVHESAVVVYRGERVLLVQRPTEGRWAGLWEFPHAELAPGEAHDSAAGRLVRELTGIDVEVGTELTTVRHGVTHHRITMVCFGAHRRAGRFRSAFYATGRWLRPAEIADYPVSAPQRRLARLLLSPSRQAHLF